MRRTCNRLVGRPRFRTTGGFSLVEVVLAIGVLSFAVIALMGLFSVGMTTDRRSTETTLVASMASQVMSDLRWHHQMTNPVLPTRYQFDAYGQLCGAGVNPVYECAVSVTNGCTDFDTGVLSVMPELSMNLQKVILSFTWPAGSPAATNTVYATLPP